MTLNEKLNLILAQCRAFLELAQEAEPANRMCERKDETRKTWEFRLAARTLSPQTAKATIAAIEAAAPCLDIRNDQSRLAYAILESIAAIWFPE